MRHACIFTVVTLLFFACKKTTHTEEIIISPPPPTPEYINISLQGKVLDENKVPIEGAAVIFGNSRTSTDSNGVFRLDSVDIDKHTPLVKVSKPGYFHGFRTFVPHEGVLNFAQLQLVPQSTSGSFSSGNGGSVEITGGSSIVFPAKGIVLAADSSAFTGNVHVSIRYLDPALSETSDMMPGDLRGVNRTGEIKALQSFGVVAVELTGDAGQKLQLAPGKPATLKLPIPSSLTAVAPANISMWWFDETRGLWKEEGTAVKQGSAYAAQIRHFSFWGSYLPITAYQFKLTLKTTAGVPLIDTRIALNDPTYITIVNMLTDNNGFASGWIWMLSGKPVKLNVLDKCGNVLYTADIPPITGNVDLGVIAVISPLLNTTVVSGKAINCNGDSVMNGYARVRIDDYNYSGVIHKGSFSIRFNRCKATPFTTSISIMDTDSSKASAHPANVVISNSSQSYNVGTLVACDTFISREEYFHLSIDGKNYSIEGKSDSLIAIFHNSGNGGYTTVTASQKKNNDYFQITNAGPKGWTAVTGAQEYFNLVIYAGLNYMPSSPVVATYSENGGVGGYLAGKISGSIYKNLSYALAPISGDFRIRIK